ncbi:helix-turn-helix domain-containing protein [Allocatelliglobosispora scoriae]|uniref:helix-turn-helix domain-containing protein n=1 Tax=Allocatelliglobosispora scoriae TaxID=643052 RepID=UPI0016151E9C
MARFTAFRFTMDPAPGQEVLLRRYAGAPRFGYNQCLRLVKGALDAKAHGGVVKVPWTGLRLDQRVQRVEAVCGCRPGDGRRRRRHGDRRGDRSGVAG